MHSGNVYSLPSDCQVLVEHEQILKADESLGRIATTTEYGGKVHVLGYEDKTKWDSISLVTAELDLKEPDVLLDRKDLQLKFSDKAPVSLFQLLVHEGGKVESGTSIAEAFVDKYVTPSSGEIRFINVETSEKNTLTGPGTVLFLPEENYQLGSTGNPLVEDSCMVQAGDEIIPGIKVRESGFVSLENLDLSQNITFYPGAYGVYFPLENSVINVTENQDVAVGELLGQLIDPETQEAQPIHSQSKGMVQFIHSEEGMYVVVRNTFTYTSEPVEKFYKLNSSHPSIDLLPVTKLMIRNGDKVKQGTSLVKVNLVFKLSAPLTLLGGKVEFNVTEHDEDGNPVKAKMSISVIENLTTVHDPSNYGLIGHQELKINSILQVKEGEVVKPGTVIAYTDFMIQSAGKVEVFKDPESGAQKLLIVNSENELKLEVDNEKEFKAGSYLFEGDKLGAKKSAHESGLIEKVSKGEILIRKARPYLVSNGSSILVSDGDMVQQGETLATLVYETVKTGDIIQGLPRVEELLEARKPKESAV
ncbi:MAG: hypothetical protein ACK4IX_10250, partial [Candidatus Sericytochromatia bacterium]